MQAEPCDRADATRDTTDEGTSPVEVPVARAAGDGSRPGPDAGFSLVETLVAIALIGTVMASLTMFFTQSLRLTAQQRGKQVAVEVAGDAMERVRALRGSSLLSGRGQVRSTQQWNAAPVQFKIDYLDQMVLAWDPLLPSASSAGDAAPLPTAPRVVRVNGVDYSQQWYVGRCRLQAMPSPAAQQVCGDPRQADPDPRPAAVDVPLFRLVITVTWPDRNCATGCLLVTSTLVSPGGDPVFNFNRRPPAVVYPDADQVGYVGTPVSLQSRATGGRLPLRWTTTGLPPGLSISTDGLISGTPTTPSPAQGFIVRVTVTDDVPQSDFRDFAWRVWQPPLLAAIPNQNIRVGTAVSLPLQPYASGGIPSLVWSATALPAGLSIDPATGVISGTPTAYNPLTSTITITDSTGRPGARTSSVTITWVRPVLTLTNPGPRSTDMGDFANLAAPTVTNGVGPYTWRATGLPEGLDINTTTGRISGYVEWGTRYLTTVYVTDSTGAEASTTFAWRAPPSKNNDFEIAAPNPANPDRAGTVGTTTTLTALATDGSGSGYTWTATGLPPGITRSGATLSGIPTTAGVYTVTLVATTASKRATLMFTWTIT